MLVCRLLQENGQKEDSVIQNDLSESFGEEVRAFLSDEEKLHLFDDLTKVNPVTTTTGNQPGRGVPPEKPLAQWLLTYGSYCSHCTHAIMNTGVKNSKPIKACSKP